MILTYLFLGPSSMRFIKQC